MTHQEEQHGVRPVASRRSSQEVMPAAGCARRLKLEDRQAGGRPQKGISGLVTFRNRANELGLSNA
jgi:hypothetical protein